MFTTNIAWTLLQGVIWFGVFTLILQFHPWHALGSGTATMLMVSGLATMGVESVLSRPAPELWLPLHAHCSETKAIPPIAFAYRPPVPP